MKKLLFISKLNFDIRENLAVRNKIYAQIAAFRESNFGCDLLFVHSRSVSVKGDNINTTLPYKGLWQYFFNLYHKIYSDILIEEYDCVYIRHWFMSPLFIYSLFRLRKLNPSCSIFMEIPAYPYDEIIKPHNLKSWFIKLGDSISNRFYRYFIDKIVTASPHKRIYGLNTINIQNGIDPTKITPIVNNDFNGKELQLLALANFQPWHGYDRLIKGISNYNNSKPTIKIVLNLVGNGPSFDSLNKLVNQLGIGQAVKFHGSKYGEELEDIIQTCHIGIGSLGLHRININGSVSSLKSREYLARGLPLVNAQKDTGFPNNFSYVLTIDSDDSDVSITEIIEFYTGLVNRYNNLSSTISKYGLTNFSWKRSLEPVINEYNNDKSRHSNSTL